MNESLKYLKKNVLNTYLEDRNAKNAAAIPAPIGKNKGVLMESKSCKNVPTSKTNKVPRQTPGKNNGINTPSDNPPENAYSAKTYRKTNAVSEFTGTKRGSKYVKLKKNAKLAVRKPEKILCFLNWQQRMRRHENSTTTHY